MGKFWGKTLAFIGGLAEYAWILGCEVVDAARHCTTPPPARTVDEEHVRPAPAPPKQSDSDIAADVEHLRSLGVKNPEAAARAFADLMTQKKEKAAE